MDEVERSRTLRRVAVVAATAAGAIGLIAAAGSLTGEIGLASWLPGAAHAKFNTSLCILLLAAAILLQLLGKGAAAGHPARLIGLVVAAVGLATVAEWITGINLGIDQLVVPDPTVATLQHPGRFAMVTAAGLSAAGLGVSAGGRKVGPVALTEVAAFACGGLGGLALLGYLYGATELLSIGSSGAVALPTAVSLGLLGAALLVSNPAHVSVEFLSDPGASGAVLRRVVAAAFLVVPAAGWLRLYGERAGLYDEDIGIAAMVVFDFAVLIVIGAWATARMAGLERKQRQAERSLVRLGVAASTPLVETAAVGLAVLDRDLRVLYRNPAFESISGAAPDDLGRRIDEIVPALARDGRRALEQVVASGANMRDLEVTGRVSPGGRIGTLLLSADAVRDIEGGIAGANMSIVEITTRKRREDALSELAEARRQALTIDQSVPYGTWIAGPDGAMRLLSESFLAMVGHSMAGAKGDGWLGYLAPEGADQARAAWRAAIAGGRSWDHELTFVAANGRRRMILSRGFPVRDEAGRVTSWAGINLDITDRTEANEFREAFTNILSHELGTPATTISGASTLLNRPGLDPERRAELIADITHESERLSRLVEDLVVLARVERGTINVRMEPVSLPQVLARACQQERRRWPDRSFELDIDPGLPVSLAEETIVEQITRDLLDNAAKFGGPRSRVDLVADALEGCPRVRVLDRGPGVDPGEVARLFEVFYRSSRTASVAGSGIGLFVAQRLVESIGGEIWARPRDDGPGAEFGFRLQPSPEEPA